MELRSGLALRWLRALFLAAVAYLTGLVAHLMANGLVPDWSAQLMLWLTCASGAAMLLGRPASRRRVVLLLVAGQTFIHVALTALAGHAGAPAAGPAAQALPAAQPPAPAPVARTGSLMDQYTASTGGASGSGQLVMPFWLQHLADDLTGPHALMAVAHLVAAVLVGLWLAAGERTLWSLVRLGAEGVSTGLGRLLAGLRLPVGAGLDRRFPVARTGWPDASPPTLLLLASAAPRRGPPVLLAA